MLDDAVLLDRARDARNGARFTRLWNGDWSGYASQSEADSALCFMLAFWTGRDAGRIDRLFRRSGLMRDKWEKRDDYREKTIENACQITSEVWDPRRWAEHPVMAEPPEGLPPEPNDPAPEAQRILPRWQTGKEALLANPPQVLTVTRKPEFPEKKASRSRASVRTAASFGIYRTTRWPRCRLQTIHHSSSPAAE